MSYEKNRKNVQIAAQWLREQGYGLWLTASRERSDPAVRKIFGSVVVGTGLYVVTAEGKAYLIANKIDVQEGQESGVFDECFVYAGNFDQVAKDFFADKIGPDQLMCINYTPDDGLADGMKLGFWKKLLKLLPEGYDFRSSQPLFAKLDLT